jgi:hypothetical protein
LRDQTPEAQIERARKRRQDRVRRILSSGIKPVDLDEP